MTSGEGGQPSQFKAEFDVPSIALFTISWCHTLLLGHGNCTFETIQTEAVSLLRWFWQSPLRTHCHASSLGSNELQRNQGEDTLAAVGWTECIKILESDLWPMSVSSSRQTTLCKQRPHRRLYPPICFNRVTGRPYEAVIFQHQSKGKSTWEILPVTDRL